MISANWRKKKNSDFNLRNKTGIYNSPNYDEIMSEF